MKNYFRDGGLAVSVIALIVLLLFMSVFTFMYSPDMFWITAPFVVLISGFAIGKLIQVTRRNFQYSALITDEIKSQNKTSLYSLPMGVAITDSERKIVWFNKNFSDFFTEEAVYGGSLDLISRLPLDKLMTEEGVDIRHNDRYYRVYGNASADREEKNIFLIYFSDITDYVNMQMEKKLSHPVVMLIKIDSFEELFSSSLESETAHVTVQIDRLLEDFIAETTGILRKQSKDKFWAVVEERHIAKLVESKVKLLDRAREIQVNDRMSVTLSIGIGRTAKTISESEDYAKQALEMAQGRGGDQAAIKTSSGFEFYGGVSKGIERSSKVKARIIANQLIQLVESSDRVYIMGHKFSDLDSVGSSVGLACAVRNLGYTAHVVVDSLASLSTQLIDRIKTSEDGKNSLFMAPADAVDSITDNSLLIITDTHNPLMLESAELHQKAKQAVIIDHHRKTVNFIDNSIIFYHEPYASSASEMVTEILGYFGNAGRITALQAEALLAGIMLDTKNFTIKTGVRTFEAAAFLRKLGADTVNVKGLFANSIESYRQRAALVSRAEIYKRCAIASTTVFSPDMRLIAPQAADELLGIENVDASFVYYRSGNDEIYISGRSLGAMNVQIVMEYLGGGGHQTMAGAQLKNATVEETGGRVREAIDKYYENLG
ncbi:MAG TPA: DHH family phosphoesterase [Ruminococcaceae bacterium]|nr:DHH family phosphoesterase [Oscillospiraceae bacterium]